MMNQPTADRLHAMRLFGMATEWEEQKRSTKTARLAFDERFGMLVDAEAMDRDNRKRDRRLKVAKLRILGACIEDFDASQARGLDISLLRTLASCTWIDEHLHVVITGPTGVGKTYLACALGQAACRKGYRVAFRRTPRLIDEIALARADGTLPRLLAKFARTDVLILDDWGMTPLREQDRRDLLEIIDDRDALRSTVLTSQIPIAKWHDYIGDPTVADAIADRLLHTAHKIVLKGPSRRARKKTKTKGGNTKN